MKLDFLRKPKGIKGTSLVLSIFTTLAFHIPAFKAVLDNIESGWNGILIFASVAILMLAVNYFFYYLFMPLAIPTRSMPYVSSMWLTTMLYFSLIMG